MDRTYPTRMADAPESYEHCHACGQTCIMGYYSVQGLGLFCSPACRDAALSVARRPVDPWLVNKEVR